MCQGKIGKIALLKSGKIGIVFHLHVLPRKIATPTSLKITLMNSTKIELLSHEVLFFQLVMFILL